MKNLLYIGNQLRHRKRTNTTIDTLGPLLETDGFKVTYASSYKMMLFRFFDMLWTVYRRKGRVDYVLIDTYSTWSFYYAFFVSQLCRLLNLKYIPILHGGNLSYRLQQNPILCQLIFSNAYKNVAPSTYMKSLFEKQGYTNLVYIPNTIQIHDYPFQVKNYKFIKLLWVRSFSKIYNPILAIKIVKNLKDEGLQASLCMVGPDKDGSLSDVKKHAESLDVDVTFIGKLSKKEWIQLSGDYNIFINTTNYDNMPVSVIEAMALGLPVISTNVGGLPFLIENNHDGILVEPDQVQGFVDAIKEILANPDKGNSLALNARRKVEAFDWERIKNQWVSLLE